MTRKILHLDLDAFFCAVEAHLNPELRGKPFAVGGQPDQRGVVAACSYEARRFGVRSAMPMSRAVTLCPDLIITAQTRKEYGKASHAVMHHLHNLTPQVEQISIDEAFLDLTMRPEPIDTLAERLQRAINTDLDLPCSLGGATNKLVAKIANTIGKIEVSQRTAGPPNAIKIILPGEEATFLAPLPATELWGIGPKTAERLQKLGIHTIGDIAHYPAEDLARHFGKQGQAMARHARGIDEREVVTSHETKSISKEITFDHDINDPERLTRTLRRMADGIGRETRKSGLTGATIKIKLRWSDFTTLTRQTTLPAPTDQDNDIYQAALTLFQQNWPPGKPVRLIGVGISGFGATSHQLGLWEDVAHTQQQRRLQSTIDDLRDRFGENAVQRGSTFRPPKTDHTNPNRR